MSEDLFEVIGKGDAEALRELLARDPEAASRKDANGISALLLACYRAREDLAEILLSAEPELGLFESAALGRIESLEQLLTEDPESARSWSPDGFTALHLAAFFGKPDAVDLLLDRGADPGAVSRNDAKLYPINSAAARGNTAAVRWLLERGADVDAAQNGGYTALHSAAHNGDLETARLLLRHGADRELTSDDGKTPLAMAEEGGHSEMADLLRTPR